MGGAVVRHELNYIKDLENFPRACQIFGEAGWLEFFEWLRGSDERVSLEFSLNLDKNKTKVIGLKLDVIEEYVSQLKTLQTEGKWWFKWKINDPSLKTRFLQGEEKLDKKGSGIYYLSLPQPWNDVALFIIKYITCEGSETIVFNYRFPLLNHLQHSQLINLSYFLLENLKHMVVMVKAYSHRESCITNHGLIKLIILESRRSKGEAARTSLEKRQQIHIRNKLKPP